MFFKKYWFALISILIGASFSVLAEFSKEHSFIFFVIFISVLMSVLGIWMEIKETEVIAKTLFMSYLAKVKYTGLNNVVSHNKMAEISRIKTELEAQVFQLTPQQMEQYTSDAIRDQIKSMNSTRTYYATHSVTDDKYLDTWGSETKEENDRDDFVQAQRELLNAGGQLVRIFVFSKSYFNDNKEKCVKMLRKHNDYYHGTALPVRTMIHFYNPQRDSSLTQDFTIVGNNIVFEWYRALGSDNDYADGKCFTDEKTAIAYMARFEELKNHSRDFNLPLGYRVNP